MAPALTRPPKRRRTNSGAPVGGDQVGILPVNEHADSIAEALDKSDILLLIGETGSGKTTQLPQQLLARSPNARVVVTQPRRVAAIAVATRVAEEQRTQLGERVGYAVRFDDRSSSDTRIRYVTDGVLLREALSNDGLNRYSHVVVDEVHERSVNTDIVLGVVKRALLAARKRRERLPFKLVIMSATTDAQKMVDFFQMKQKLSLSVLRVPGRLHPVETMYTAEPVSDFIDGAVTAALQVHVDYAFPGDVLVFLPGQDEILSAVSLLQERVQRYLPPSQQKSIHIHSLFASLPQTDQMRAIAPLVEAQRMNTRKVIFATNIAETSITIPGIKYVIDSGLAKVRGIHAAKGVHADVLRLAPISQAQAEQRKGRAGRVSAGYVFRLYTSALFKSLPAFPVPEILRVDAAASLLQITALGCCSGEGAASMLRTFPFVDHPPRRAKERGLEALVLLGALDESMGLTETGRLMAQIPVNPNLARALLESARLGCIDAVVSAAAMLSVEGSVFLSPPARREAARAAHRRFASAHGDTIALVNALDAFVGTEGNARRVEFCRDHFLNFRSLSAALSVREQLRGILGKEDVVRWAATPPAAGREASVGVGVMEAIAEADREELVLRCIVAGFFRNVAKRSEDGKYKLLSAGGVADTSVDIHPSSVLRNRRRGKGPEIVVYDELVVTSKPYLRNVVRVKIEWLWQHSNGFFSKTGGGL